MAGIKEIRTRITSVTSTQKITKAMKMVSAAKLRKAQTQVQQMRPYSIKLKEILQNLCSGLDVDDNAYMQERTHKKVLLLVVTSNSGLCGALNSNIARQAIQIAKDKYSEQYSNGDVDFLPIGKKGGDFLKSKSIVSLLPSITEIYNELNFATASALAQDFMDSFIDKKYDVIEIIYNKFINAAQQEVCTEQFLPIPKDSVDNNTYASSKYKHDFIFEPSKEKIIHEIVPRTLKTEIFQILLESVASEHGARMTAMHKATDNAGELLKALKIDYNKARQATITNEILEIVSGANALANS